MARTKFDVVELTQPDAAWSAFFEREKRNLQEFIGQFATSIAHVGSTSIPGISAKPILDIAIHVADLTRDGDFCIAPLRELGYEYVPSENSANRRFFRRGVSGLGTHHLHLFQSGTPEAQAMLLFRDYLCAHPSVAQEYDNLKQTLFQQFGNDRDTYTASKGAFVKSVLERACREGRQP